MVFYTRCIEHFDAYAQYLKIDELRASGTRHHEAELVEATNLESFALVLLFKTYLQDGSRSENKHIESYIIDQTCRREDRQSLANAYLSSDTGFQLVNFLDIII